MNTTLAAVAALALLLLAACSEGDPPAATATGTSEGAPASTAGDATLAPQMLLVLADFPAGWAEEPAPPTDEPHPYDECPSIRSVPSTALADSPVFTDTVVALRHFVVLLDTAEAARGHMGVMEQRMACIADIINAGAIDTAGEHFSEAQSDVVPFSRVIGDESVVHRLGFLVRGADGQGRISADILTFRVGRSLHTLQGPVSGVPFRAGDMAPFGETAAERAASVLGEASP